VIVTGRSSSSVLPSALVTATAYDLDLVLNLAVLMSPAGPLVGGIPLHPLVVHAVVVLLPLSAVGAIAVAVRPAWRRQLGVPVLLLAIAGVAAVPVAVWSGGYLREMLGGGGPLVEIHEARAMTLLPVALAFVVLLAVTVLTGRYADRDEPTRGGSATVGRVALGSGILAALAGLAVTGLVIWIGHAGSAAAWSGVVG
jgi:hypothetical protein